MTALVPPPGLVRSFAAPELPAQLFPPHQKLGDGEDRHQREHELQKHPLHRTVGVFRRHQIPRDSRQLHGVDAEDEERAPPHPLDGVGDGAVQPAL